MVETCQDSDLVVRDAVHNTVGEAPKQRATVPAAVRQHLVHRRVLYDVRHRRVQIRQESTPQARHTGLIPAARFPNLGPRARPEDQAPT